MLLIFWDTKENSETKKTIAKKMGNAERDIPKSINNQSLAINKNSLAKVIFTNAHKIRHLNKSYRKINQETDVLSFAESDVIEKLPILKENYGLGEIYLNYDWVKRDKNPIKLVIELFIHGYLHLLGYDHEKDRGEMEKLEKKLRKNIFK